MYGISNRMLDILNDTAETVYADLIKSYRAQHAELGDAVSYDKSLLKTFGQMTNDERYAIAYDTFNPETVELMKAMEVYPYPATSANLSTISSIANTVFVIGSDRAILDKMLAQIKRRDIVLTIDDIFDSSVLDRETRIAIKFNRPKEVIPGKEGFLWYYEASIAIHNLYAQQKNENWDMSGLTA